MSDKKSELKALDRKVRPMEDMFGKFQSWLEGSRESLASLSPPPSLEQERERERTTRQAQVHCVHTTYHRMGHRLIGLIFSLFSLPSSLTFPLLPLLPSSPPLSSPSPPLSQSIVEDVDLHKGSLERLETTVGAVLPLLDEPDQDQLRAQLEDLTNQYNCHSFNSEGYLVERWVEGKEAELVAMAPTAVQPPALQVQYYSILALHMPIQIIWLDRRSMHQNRQGYH